jgi:enterochelin esterase-like enzyme
MVDCWTSVGGSQYLDSPGTGNYHSYLCEDVVGFVDARHPTLAHRDHRAITGKSSGGYGAMITPMLRPMAIRYLAERIAAVP